VELVLEHPRCRPCGGKDAPQMAMLAKYRSGGMTPPGGTVVRIDAGSAVSYTDSKGQVWSADTDSVGGATVNRGAITIANTTDPQTEHYRMSGYRVPVPNGTYTVNLEFAEPYLTAAGQAGLRCRRRRANSNQPGCFWASWRQRYRIDQKLYQHSCEQRYAGHYFYATQAEPGNKWYRYSRPIRP